jgi:hypothetical protein
LEIATRWVPAEIAKYLHRPAERPLGIDNPICPKQSTQESGEAFGIGQMLKAPAEMQLVAAKGSSKTGDKLAPEHSTEDFNRQEEWIAGTNPLRMIRRQAAGGNCVVHMGMVQQVLSPGVENAEESDLGAEMPGIGGHLQKSGRRGTEEQIVKDPLVLQGQRAQLAEETWRNVRLVTLIQFAMAST